MEPRQQRRPRRRLVPALVSLLAIGAAIAAWIATRHGPGLSPDSVTYLSLARNLSAGKGYVDLTGQPNTTFAPGFPAVLAAGHVVGLAASTASRLLNVACDAAVVVLAWVLLRRHTASRTLALAATALVVVSPALLNVSSHAWSEPLFCVVVLGFILVLEEALSCFDPRRQLVLAVGAGLLAGVGFLVRYAALTLLAVGVIVLLLSRETARARIQRVTVFALAAIPLPAIWLIRNASSSNRYLLGPRTTVADSVHALVTRFGDGIVAMFVTLSSTMRTQYLVLLPIVALMGVGLLVGLRRRGTPTIGVDRPSVAPLVTFILVYSVSVVVSGKTAGSSVDLRIVMPVFVPVVVVAARLASRALTAARAAPTAWARSVVYLLAAAVAVGLVSSADSFVETAWTTGRAAHGYATDTLESSALARAVKAHAGRSRIVTTNSPWALYSATGHQPIFPLPALYPSASLAPPTIDMLGDAACEGPVFFAWFARSSHPSTDLGRGLSLTVVESVSDGLLYAVHRPRGQCGVDRGS